MAWGVKVTDLSMKSSPRLAASEIYLTLKSSTASNLVAALFYFLVEDINLDPCICPRKSCTLAGSGTDYFIEAWASLDSILFGTIGTLLFRYWDAFELWTGLLISFSILCSVEFDLISLLPDVAWRLTSILLLAFMNFEVLAVMFILWADLYGIAVLV